MKKRFSIQKKSLPIMLIFIFYSLIAGGSLEDMGVTFIIVIVAAIVGSGVSMAIASDKKEKRINQKKQLEASATEFDITDRRGDDRCTLYFDKSKKKVMIAFITERCVNKYIVDDFEKDLVSRIENTVCVIDVKQRKAIVVDGNDSKSTSYSVIEYSEKDFNKEIVSSNSIQPQLKGCMTMMLPPLYVLVEESFGFISVFKDGKLYDSFNYISKDYITKKNVLSSSVTIKSYGAYTFILDDFFKVLTIVSSLSSHTVLNYKDIIDVTYEEDGTTLYTKSASRTVGGALVGGALLGGAGAIVGGLSGNSKQNKVVKSMFIKILVRNTTTPTVSLNINYTGETYQTKNASSKTIYDARVRSANQIKDLLSVVIDEGKNISQVPMQPKANQGIGSVADELVKLAKLKEQGLLTEEEFNAQKAKLLS